MLAGLLKADGNEQVPELNVSYKPQKISPSFPVSMEIGNATIVLHRACRSRFLYYVGNRTNAIAQEDQIHVHESTIPDGRGQAAAD